MPKTDYRIGSHSVFDIKLHIVWITKYRYPVLNNQKMAGRVRELIRLICSSLEINILGGVVSSDHIHLHVSIPPNISVSKLVMQLKGASSRKIQQEFPEIKHKYWGQHFWARGYFVASTGNVTNEIIQNYIANHGKLQNEEDKFFIESLAGF